MGDGKGSQGFPMALRGPGYHTHGKESDTTQPADIKKDRGRVRLTDTIKSETSCKGKKRTCTTKPSTQGSTD